METANTIAAINETTGLAPAAGGVVMLETALIDPNPANPRRDVGDVGELADSIRAQGIRQNLLVVPAPEGRFTLVIGHRSSAIGGWRPRNWRDWNGFRRSWPSWTNGNSAS